MLSAAPAEQVFEAETAILSGSMAVGSDVNANGGGYVSGQGYYSDPTDNYAEFLVNIDSAGKYGLNARASAVDVSSDSFFITVNGEPTNGHIWDVASGIGYSDDCVTSRATGGNPIVLDLTAGQHSIRFHVREEGARLDSVGIVSLGSPTLNVGQLVEAELGALVGSMSVRSEVTASGGLYVAGDGFASSPSNNYVEFRFDVPFAGDYTLDARVSAESASADSFFVTINDQPAAGHIWDVPEGQGYVQDQVSSRGNEDPLILPLTAGIHTVRFHLREQDTRLDTIQLQPVNRGVTFPPNQTIQAEAGTLSGNMSVRNDALASGGQYVAGDGYASAVQDDYVEFVFDVLAAGDYTIDTLVSSPNASSDSFFVTVNGVPTTGYIWDTPEGLGYVPDQVSNRGVGTVTLSLSPGLNAVRFHLREQDTRLDTVRLNQLGADFGVISMGQTAYTADEGDANVEIQVVRHNGTDGTVTIEYNTNAISATAGSDYTPTSGTLSFAPGQTVGVITVPLLDDANVEPIETFSVTLDNPGGGAELLVPRTSTVSIVDDESPLPDFTDFSSVADLSLNGSASQSNNLLQLTPLVNNQAGSAFFDTAVSIANDAHFRAQFSFDMTGGVAGADGLTFTLQADPAGAAALGGTGGGLGFDGIANAVAVEFDTWQNPGEVNNNHIAVIAGSTTNSLRLGSPSSNLNDGNRYWAWVEYNGTSDVLAVYFSPTATKPTEALLSTNVDLESVVGPNAFFGFTAGTGGANNAHRIYDWTMDQIAPPQFPPTGAGDNVVAIDVIDAGLNQPVAIDWLPNGTMLIAEKGGIVRTASLGTLNPSVFLDIRDIVNGVRDRGLLDIAVHPDFDNNPYVYLLFTYDPPEVSNFTGDSGPDGKNNRAGRLIRVTADVANNYETAVANSEIVLLGANSTWQNFNGLVNSTFNFDEPPAGENADGSYVQDFIPSDSESHTVGALAFGTDGNLFVSIGDGASYNRVDIRADRVQDLDSLSGKVLRIDPISGLGLSDNPHYNGDPAANRSKVYQRGLRNPFRMSVDSLTGQLFVGDVGWSTWEEINAAGPGANFGWPFYEGDAVQNGYANTTEGQAFFADPPPVNPPLYALNHAADGINAIVLGDVYRGGQYGAEYEGDVFFNDLGGGIVRHASLDASGTVIDVQTFTTGANVVVAMSQGPDGLLYYVDLDDGTIGRWEFI